MSTPVPDFSTPRPVHGLAPSAEETRCGLDARTNGGGIPYGFGLHGVNCADCLRAADERGAES